MSDLIDRQAALDIFDDYNVAVENGQIEAYSRDRKRLCDLPPAQPQIIRCKDCKFRENDDFCTGRGFPYQLVPDDGFCDKGERKE